MDGMVHLALTQPVSFPVKGMLPPPENGPDFKMCQTEFLAQFTSQCLIDGFGWLNSSPGCDPERTNSG
jgi:hypothetical protein